VSVYADGETLTAELQAAVARFFAEWPGPVSVSDVGAERHRLVVALRIHHPDAEVVIDLDAKTVSLGAPGERPSLELDVDADLLHHTLLGNLDPVQICRGVEEHRVHGEGDAETLATLIVAAGQFAPHYRASLEERGRRELLDAAAPETGVWEKPGPFQVHVGTKRAWQIRRRGPADTSSQPVAL
jgi:hypothetical protein